MGCVESSHIDAHSPNAPGPKQQRLGGAGKKKEMAQMGSPLQVPRSTSSSLRSQDATQFDDIGAAGGDARGNVLLALDKVDPSRVKSNNSHAINTGSLAQLLVHNLSASPRGNEDRPAAAAALPGLVATPNHLQQHEQSQRDTSSRSPAGFLGRIRNRVVSPAGGLGGSCGRPSKKTTTTSGFLGGSFAQATPGGLTATSTMSSSHLKYVAPAVSSAEDSIRAWMETVHASEDLSLS